jgi:hypothetical protein
VKVLENRVLGKVFKAVMDEVREEYVISGFLIFILE